MGLYTLPYVKLPAPDEMAGEIEETASLGRRPEKMAPWAIRRNSNGHLVGMTGYVNPLPEHRRLTLGATWVATSAHNTGVNQESKYLLMRRAFEELDCIAVEFRANRLNERHVAPTWRSVRTRMASCAPALMADSTVKDVVYFSVIADEWPAVGAALAAKLATKSG